MDRETPKIDAHASCTAKNAKFRYLIIDGAVQTSATCVKLFMQVSLFNVFSAAFAYSVLKLTSAGVRSVAVSPLHRVNHPEEAEVRSRPEAF